MHRQCKKLLEYSAIGAFVVAVSWGTLLAIDALDALYTDTQVSYDNIPENLRLKSAASDVLYAQAYRRADGQEELSYAYMAGEPEVEEEEDISRRTPNSRTEVLAVEEKDGERIETLKTAFYAKPQFYEEGGQWRQIEYATTTPEAFAASGAIRYVQKREWWERLLPGKPLFALTSTFNPDPSAESTSVDGYIDTDGTHFDPEGFCSQSVAFSDARGKTTGTAYDSSTSLTAGANSSGSGTTCSANIDRAILLFDTSSLSAAAEITSATLSLYALSKINTDNDGTDYIGVVSSAPASNTAVVGGDYDSLGTTLYAQYDITSITTGATLSMALNSSGEAAVSLTGITKFGLREGHDNTNSALANNGSNLVNFSSAETSGTSQDPELEVVYTLGSFSFGQWFPF